MPRPSHRPASHTTDVRDRLLQAAAELIPQYGWSAVSTRMIAERAGVTAGLVHYHFGSVQALLTDAAIGTIRTVIGGVGAALDSATSPQQVLNLLFGALDGYNGRDPFSLLLSEAYLAAGRDDRLRDGLTGVVTEFREDLAAVLRTHHVADPDATAGVVAAALDGIVLHRAIGLPLPAATVTTVLTRALQVARPRAARATTRTTRGATP